MVRLVSLFIFIIICTWYFFALEAMSNARPIRTKFWTILENRVWMIRFWPLNFKFAYDKNYTKNYVIKLLLFGPFTIAHTSRRRHND